MRSLPLLVAALAVSPAGAAEPAPRRNVVLLIADDLGRVRVPPENPSYTLRRVWLTREEEQRYYYGFSNEALWPLCHVAYTPPRFDATDWEQYRRVNRKFADAVLDEAGDGPAIVFVQDYHFALLPRMIRERLPRAIAIYHIGQVAGPAIAMAISAVLMRLLTSDRHYRARIAVSRCRLISASVKLQIQPGDQFFRQLLPPNDHKGRVRPCRHSNVALRDRSRSATRALAPPTIPAGLRTGGLG